MQNKLELYVYKQRKTHGGEVVVRSGLSPSPMVKQADVLSWTTNNIDNLILPAKIPYPLQGKFKFPIPRKAFHIKLNET